MTLQIPELSLQTLILLILFAGILLAIGCRTRQRSKSPKITIRMHLWPGETNQYRYSFLIWNSDSKPVCLKDVTFQAKVNRQTSNITLTMSQTIPPDRTVFLNAYHDHFFPKIRLNWRSPQQKRFQSPWFRVNTLLR